MWSQEAADVTIANRYCNRQNLSTLYYSSAAEEKKDAVIALDIDPSTKLARGCGTFDPLGHPRAKM